MSTQREIIEAVRNVAGNAETLFQWIKGDLERGSERTARHHLDFVDALLAQEQPPQTETPSKLEWGEVDGVLEEHREMVLLLRKVNDVLPRWRMRDATTKDVMDLYCQVNAWLRLHEPKDDSDVQRTHVPEDWK